MQTVLRPPIYATTLHDTEAARAMKSAHEADHVVDMICLPAQSHVTHFCRNLTIASTKERGHLVGRPDK